MADHTTVKQNGAVLEIIFARPDKKNGMSNTMYCAATDSAAAGKGDGLSAHGFIEAHQGAPSAGRSGNAGGVRSISSVRTGDLPRTVMTQSEESPSLSKPYANWKRTRLSPKGAV